MLLSKYSNAYVVVSLWRPRKWKLRDFRCSTQSCSIVIKCDRLWHIKERFNCQYFCLIKSFVHIFAVTHTNLLLSFLLWKNSKHSSRELWAQMLTHVSTECKYQQRIDRNVHNMSQDPELSPFSDQIVDGRGNKFLRRKSVQEGADADGVLRMMNTVVKIKQFLSKRCLDAMNPLGASLACKFHKNMTLLSPLALRCSFRSPLILDK